MKRNKHLRQLLLGSFVLLSLLLTAFVLDRYQKGGRLTEPVEAPPKSTADLSFNQFHYSESRNGKPLWDLNADSADHDLETGLTRVTNVQAIFYDRDGLGDVELSAAEGVWQEQTKQLRVKRDVVLKSPEGYTCFADQLVYSEADAHLRSDGPVRLLSNQVELQGVGLDIDIAARTFKLLAKVWASWQVNRLLKEDG